MAARDQSALGLSGDSDAWAPAQIAVRVEESGVTKARTDPWTILHLAVLAGAFIAMGAALFLVAVTGSELGWGATRVLGGLVFSLGLVLVVVAGAELFTGNNLIAIAWASRRIRTSELLRNWALVYVGNVVGAAGTAVLLNVAGTHLLHDGALGDTAVAVAAGKVELTNLEALSRGILCNALVCLGVWLAMGGRSVTDKIVGVVFPITAFVALGLEHSIANWFFFPYALLIDGTGAVTWFGALRNLALVSVGNIVGGTILVAGIYWMAYLRSSRK